MFKKLYEWMCTLCIKVADWSSHPLAIVLVPILCILYLFVGKEASLTLVLSIVAISLTQMVLRSQSLETEANKLQMAELIKAIPGARDEVANDHLTEEEIKSLKEKQ